MTSILQRAFGFTGAIFGGSRLARRYANQYLTEIRNLGIIFAFMAFLCVMYLLASEKIHTQRSKGEILVFCRDKAAKFPSSNDEEAWTPDQPTTNGVEKTRSHASKYLSASNETRAATFLWDELSYDVPVRSGSRRLLHSVEGWIKPGTLTALMVCHSIDQNPPRHD